MQESALRFAIARAVEPLRSMPTSGSRVQAIRAQMAAAPARLRSLLRQIGQLDLAIPGEHPLSDALGKLSDVYRAGTTRLARWESNPLAPAPARKTEAGGSARGGLAAAQAAPASTLQRTMGD